MIQQRTAIKATASAAGMLLLILDSKTALTGAAEGIDLCLRTLIPSLLPFFPLSMLLTSALTGRTSKCLQPVGRLLGMPSGSECILPIGLLGGYPAGALMVRQCWENKQLQKEDAHRLLGFCSNAGPGFIFGIVARLFCSPVCPWILWGIHILSAILTGIMIPGSSNHKASSRTTQIDLSSAVQKSVGILASVCTWVILFRVLLAFCSRWFLWLLPEAICAAFAGFLELANGLHQLAQIEEEYLRFILAAMFLGFGGLCVSMQTVSVTSGLGTGWYFPGKVLQSILSVMLSAMACVFLFPESINPITGYLFILLGITAITAPVIIAFVKKKKPVAFSGYLVYNGGK